MYSVNVTVGQKEKSNHEDTGRQVIQEISVNLKQLSAMGRTRCSACLWSQPPSPLTCIVCMLNTSPLYSLNILVLLSLYTTIRVELS